MLFLSNCWWAIKTPFFVFCFFTDLEKNGILSTSITFEDESDNLENKNYPAPKKNVPPVKKKMLWKQKKKSYQLQSIPFQNPEIEEDIKFNEEELDVPKTTRLFKVTRVLKLELKKD